MSNEIDICGACGVIAFKDEILHNFWSYTDMRYVTFGVQLNIL